MRTNTFDVTNAENTLRGAIVAGQISDPGMIDTLTKQMTRVRSLCGENDVVLSESDLEEPAPQKESYVEWEHTWTWPF